MENRAGSLFHGLMSKGWDLITTVGVVGCGLIGGVFFAFSAFVMSGLNRLPPSRATAAMQSINVTAQHPPLMLALFGTAAVCGSPASPDAPAHWQHFITLWTLANHARAALSLAACALLAVAVLQGAPAGKPGAMPHLKTNGPAGSSSVWPPAVR
jgi:uncharacterized membrane protein